MATYIEKSGEVPAVWRFNAGNRFVVIQMFFQLKKSHLISALSTERAYQGDIFLLLSFVNVNIDDMMIFHYLLYYWL